MAEKIEIVAELKDLVSGHLKDITSQIGRLDGKLSSVGSKGGDGIMGQVLGANLLTGAIQRGIGAIYEFGKESAQAFGKMEQFQTSLTTMFHGNKEEANTLMNQLKRFALETPFELTEIQDATKMMIAYGSTSGGVVGELKTLGDISSGVGSSLGEVAYLYGTLRTQGRAYAMDIRQFTGRGIPIVAELAKQFKVSESQVMNLVGAGKVGFPQIEKAFKSMTGEGGQFFNLMNAQSKTLLGQTSNLSDAWGQLKTNIGQSQEGILKGTVSWATDMIQQFTKMTSLSNQLNANNVGGVNMDMFNLSEDGITYIDKQTGKFTNSKTSRYYNRYSPSRPGMLEQNQNSGVANSSGYTSRLYDDVYNSRTTDRARLEKFNESIFDKMSNIDPNNASGKRNELTEIYKELVHQRKEGVTSNALFGSEGAILNQALKNVNEILRSSKAEKTKQGKDGQIPANLETLAKANRQTVTNITIENLVREINATYEGTSEASKMSIGDFAKMVSKVLTGAVNDVTVAPN